MNQLNFCSPCWFNAHWSFHPATAEWGKELWGASEQALQRQGAYGHPSIHRHTCGLPHYSKSKCHFTLYQIIRFDAP